MNNTLKYQKCKKKTLNLANYSNFAFFFCVSIIITIIFFFHMLGLWRYSRFNTYQHVEKIYIVTQVYHLSVYNKSLRCVYMCIIIYYICVIHTYIYVYICVYYMYICIYVIYAIKLLPTSQLEMVTTHPLASKSAESAHSLTMFFLVYLRYKLPVTRHLRRYRLMGFLLRI